MLFAWSPWVGFGGKKELLEMYRIILKAFGICNIAHLTLSKYEHHSKYQDL